MFAPSWVRVDWKARVWLGFWLLVAAVLAVDAPPARPAGDRVHLAALTQFKTVASDGRLLTKPIQDIRPGDTVMARNDATGIVSPCRVAHVMTHRVLELCILHIQSADDKEIQVLQTTPPHPFWVPGRGWVRAGDLTPGQELLQTDNGRAEVLRVARESRPEGITVFNIEVERDHTYFVAAHGLRGPPVLVHNKAQVIGDIPVAPARVLPSGIRKYLRDVEQQTGRRIPRKQFEELKDALRHQEFTKRTKEQTARHRAEFDKVKNRLIQDWERETGQKWPRYTEDVLSKDGTKIVRKKGDAYDAHHIIENELGGPAEWWNIHPARFPDEHQGGIHRSGSPLRQLLGNIN